MTANTGVPPRDAGRLAWVDVAKGICIVLVVMMHTTLGLGEAVGREGWLHDVVAFATPFRIPAFFLLSGLFLARVIDRDWKPYADKRVVHFAYFYLLWLVIQSLARLPETSGGSAAGFLGHVATALVEPYGTLWFVYLLAVFSVLTKLLRRVSAPMLLIGAAMLEILPVETGWTVIDYTAERYVFFLAGYLLAPLVFVIAGETRRRPGAAVTGLALWAVVNAVFAFSTTGHPYFQTWASLPFLSLGLGAAGALAIVAVASLLTQARLAAPLAYVGSQSLSVYLAFFLPMAACRIIAVKYDLVQDVGTTAAIITLIAVLVPLALERIVRGTPAAFLFMRPATFRLTRDAKAAKPAEAV